MGCPASQLRNEQLAQNMTDFVSTFISVNIDDVDLKIFKNRKNCENAENQNFVKKQNVLHRVTKMLHFLAWIGTNLVDLEKC